MLRMAQIALLLAFVVVTKSGRKIDDHPKLNDILHMILDDPVFKSLDNHEQYKILSIMYMIITKRLVERHPFFTEPNYV